MSDSVNEDSRARSSLTQQQKGALLGELLGDVQLLHRSVGDLVAITRDADQRISSRVVELRTLAANLAGVRETMLAELAVQASTKSQRAFREAMGELLVKGIDRSVMMHSGRRFFDLAAVALTSSLLTAVLSFGIAWSLHH